MKKIIEKIKKSWLIKRTTTLLLMAFLVAIFIAISILVSNLKLNPIDFTSEKLYTLTDISKERTKNIEKDVNIYFIGYSEGAAVLDLAKQYHNANEKINVETATSTQRPDLVQKYGISEGSTGIIVESGEKTKILSNQDFYTYDMTLGKEIDITEEKLTNAILYVTADKIPTVYFLQGYSEFSVNQNMNYLTTYLENEVTQYKTLNLLAEGQIPEDCDTLIITTPSKDFDDIATASIVNYINKGGNILWFNMAITAQQNLTNVNKILSMYGVKPFEVGVINETDIAKMQDENQTIIIPTVNYSTITKNIPGVLMINATKLNFVSDEELQKLNVTKTNIMQTSENAFFRTNFAIMSNRKEQNEEEGSFIVAAELDKIVENTSQKTSKLIIYGENLFISDYTLTQSSSYPLIMYSYNKDLAIDSIAYLVDRQEDIVIRKNTNTTNYTATVEQNTIIQAIIYGVPVLIIIAGIVVWQIRRRKK